MVVPADWKEVKVADVIVDSFSGPSPTCLERNIQGEEWGVFKTTCSTMEQGWDYTKHKVLPRAFWGMTRSLIEVGDTVITKAGPRHRVGVASYVNRTLDRLIVSGKMIGLRPNKTVVCPPFLALALSSKPTQEFLNQRTTGMAESQVNFENVALLETPLYLPPLKEQEAIAEALSDADAAIESLDALIAKKRDVKQATMQQLLTGRTRLPGFTADWKEVRLGDLGRCLRGVSYKGDSDLSDGDSPTTVRLLRSNNVQNSLIQFNDVQYVNHGCVSDEQILRRNDIVICMANGSKVLVGKTGLYKDSQDTRYTFGAFMGCFRSSSDQAHAIFVRYLFLTKQYQDYISNLLAGSSINNLTPKSIESLLFNVPLLKEQEVIAEALSVMDDELEALTEQVSKLRMVKEGMMQDLLTGKVRLV